MYLIVQMHSNAVQAMIEAIDSDRFHETLEGAKRMATGIRSGKEDNYEVVELKSVWNTIKCKPRRKMKW